MRNLKMQDSTLTREVALSAARLSASEYLSHCQPIKSLRWFAVGTFERNITLYRQQMRALNLVHALYESDVATGEIGSLAVVGGGAFGITAAVAAAWLGFDVRLFERQETVLPLQRGCDTRWISPLYYEWPSFGSETRYAGLPLMNWQAGTASQVADQLERQFLAHKAAFSNLRCYVGLKNFKSTADRRNGKFIFTCKHLYDGHMEQLDWRCGAVILATGFGVENDLGSDTNSYWRNDNIGQLEIKRAARAKKYLVSGTGDGGLTDVARLKIVNFRHERVFSELFGDSSESLLDVLRNLRDEWSVKTTASDDWLF